MHRSSCWLAAAALTAGIASAQVPEPVVPRKPPTPEEMQKSVGALMDGMIPTMGRMTSAVIETQLVEAEKPDTAERMAAFEKNFYEALVRKGFTRDQALQLTIATPLPSGASTGR